VKKAPAQKSKYLGQVVDKEKMEFIRPGNVTMKHEKLILDFGDAYFLVKFMENRMKDVYDFALKNGILPLILYRILGKTSMRRARTWYEDSITRYLSPGDMHSQRISELLAQIGEESVLRDFYKMYLKQPEDGISIDTTALTNQIDMDMTQWRHSSETNFHILILCWNYFLLIRVILAPEYHNNIIEKKRCTKSNKKADFTHMEIYI
jgi:hypothetical protein